MNSPSAAILAIRAEAYALDRLADSLGDSFNAACALLLACEGKIIATGMGKAGNIAAKIAATLRSTGSPAAFLNPAEAAHGDMGMIGPGDCLLALSNSGETDEVRAVAEFCRRRMLPAIAITGHPESSLALRTQAAIILPTVPEGCPLGLSPMASAAMMLAIGDGLAAELMSARGFTSADFLKLHHGGYLGRRLSAVA